MSGGGRHGGTLRRGVALAALGCVALTASVAPAEAVADHAATSSWTTFGDGPSRLATQSSDAPAPPLREAWTQRGILGQVYGQPLIAGGRVYVATEADEVYALAASTGRILWRRSVGAAVPATDLPCGDIGPTVGVTSTMVLDPTSDRLFVSAAVLVAGSVRHELLGLSGSSGAVQFRRDLDQPGWDAAAQLQRGALGLDEGEVLVGFGGNDGDCGSYHGWEMAVPASGKGPTLVYRVPTANEGAIWGAAGMAIASDGDVYVATGNGSSTGAFDFGDAVIELSPAMREKAFFAPVDWALDNAEDLDLGSTAPMLLPGGKVFEVGKEATAYLLDAARLGGIRSAPGSAEACNSRGSGAYDVGIVFVACPDSGMVALRVHGDRLSVLWHAPDAPGSPSVGAGVVWSVADGTLIGLAPRSGAVVDEVPAPATEHFATPSIADGLLLVGGADEVEAFR